MCSLLGMAMNLSPWFLLKGIKRCKDKNSSNHNAEKRKNLCAWDKQLCQPEVLHSRQIYKLVAGNKGSISCYKHRYVKITKLWRNHEIIRPGHIYEACIARELIVSHVYQAFNIINPLILDSHQACLSIRGLKYGLQYSFHLTEIHHTSN